MVKVSIGSWWPWILAAWVSAAAASEVPPADTVNCYLPIEGGWRIRITADPKAPRREPGSAIGVVGDDPRTHRRPGCGYLPERGWDYNFAAGPWDDARTHRRPLYPPVDRTLVWSKEEIAAGQRLVSFRPRILCANEPRVLIDRDNAGGHSGHLLLGLSVDGGASKWLHYFDNLDVRYVEGRMEYAVRDAAFPGVTVRLTVWPLAESVGLVMKLRVEGLSRPGELVWVFGGASGYTHYKFTDGPAFRFSPDQCDENAVRWENGQFLLPAQECRVARRRQLLARGRGLRRSAQGPRHSRSARRLGTLVPRKETGGDAQLCCHAENSVGQVAVGRADRRRRRRQDRIAVGRPPPRPSNSPGHEASRSPIALRSTPPDPYLDAAIADDLAVDGRRMGRYRRSCTGRGHGTRLISAGATGTDRCAMAGTIAVRRSIQQHASLGLIRSGPDQGALSHSLEDARRRVLQHE